MIYGGVLSLFVKFSRMKQKYQVRSFYTYVCIKVSVRLSGVPGNTGDKHLYYGGLGFALMVQVFKIIPIVLLPISFRGREAVDSGFHMLMYVCTVYSETFFFSAGCSQHHGDLRFFLRAPTSTAVTLPVRTSCHRESRENLYGNRPPREIC